MPTTEQPVLLERIYPKEMNSDDRSDAQSIELHMNRYRFASKNLLGEEILDMACGCGFGTALMAQAHPEKRFTGVDIDPDAISYAKSKYQADNLTYVCADALSWTSGHYDSIVSLETIEHLPTPDLLISNMVSLLADGGRVIASVPVTPTCDGNPHHLHDFSIRSFKALFFLHGFSKKDEFKQVQAWEYSNLFSNAKVAQRRSHGVGNNVLRYYRKQPLALVSRVTSILRYGLCNIYLTAVFEKSE